MCVCSLASVLCHCCWCCYFCCCWGYRDFLVVLLMVLWLLWYWQLLVFFTCMKLWHVLLLVSCTVLIDSCFLYHHTAPSPHRVRMLVFFVAPSLLLLLFLRESCSRSYGVIELIDSCYCSWTAWQPPRYTEYAQLTVAILLGLNEIVTRRSSGVFDCFNWRLLLFLNCMVMSHTASPPHTECACWCFLLLLFLLLLLLLLVVVVVSVSVSLSLSLLLLLFPPTPRSRAFFQTYSPMEIGCLCAFRTLGVRFRASGGGGCFCPRFVHWMIHCMIYTLQACPTLRYILYTCPNLM